MTSQLRPTNRRMAHRRTDWVAHICEVSVMRLLESATHARPISTRCEADNCGKLHAHTGWHDASTNTVPQPHVRAARGSRLARRTGNALPRSALDSHGMQSGAPCDACCHQRCPARRIPLRQPQHAGVPLLRTPRCLQQDARRGVRTVASIGCRRVERRPSLAVGRQRRSDPPCSSRAPPSAHRCTFATPRFYCEPVRRQGATSRPGPPRRLVPAPARIGMNHAYVSAPNARRQAAVRRGTYAWIGVVSFVEHG